MTAAEVAELPLLRSVHAWADNAELIADIAAHGRYLWADAIVLDPTFGLGNFWSRWKPNHLFGSDIDPARHPWGESVDCRRLPWNVRAFDVVVFDPPYKLNGTPTEAVDAPYGVADGARWQDRMDLIADGTTEACRVARRYVLVKCQDQVVSGRIRWQTDLVTRAGEAAGFRKVDRFDLVGHARPQPSGRRQVHARGRGSSLIVLGRDS